MATPRPDLRRRAQAQRAEALARDMVRSRRVVARHDGVRMEIDGRWLLNFCGNDYLGLSQQFQVVDAMQNGAARDGVGGVSSHLVCGHHVAHEALEREIADWLEMPRALVFGSGYMANLAVQQALLGDGDTSVQDRLNHASLIDGARLAGCRLRRYPHGDAEGALRQLRTVPTGAAMIATDGVFSMDGDVAPLRQLAIAARMQSALLYVDDAHGIGVLGPGGRGSVADARLGVADVPLQLVTLGKALGGHGAVVVGDLDLVEHLAGTARPYLYTTALSPPQAAAALAAVKLARREHWRREKLVALVQRFREGMQARGFQLPESDTPIQPVPCGDNARALGMSARLEAEGFRVAAIRPPTVPEGRARLRVTFCAAHGEDQVDALVVAIARARDQVDAARAA